VQTSDRTPILSAGDKTTANPVNTLELALQSQPRKCEVKIYIISYYKIYNSSKQTNISHTTHYPKTLFSSLLVAFMTSNLIQVKGTRNSKSLRVANDSCKYELNSTKN